SRRPNPSRRKSTRTSPRSAPEWRRKAMNAQTFRDVLAQEEAAERAIYNSDAEPYKALWSHADDVTLFGAFGPCKVGWAELSRTFDWVAHRYQGGTVSQEYEAIVEAGDVAYTVALEHGRVALDGDPNDP